ncbi:hypothetical protein D3C76_790500 [compost metagenome]
MRLQGETPPGRVHAGQVTKLRAQPADFHAQTRTMGFIGMLRAKCPRNQRVPWHVRGPRFRQRASEREQHRTRGERDRGVGVAYHMAAGVHDQRPGGQQCLDVCEQERSLSATSNQARGGRVQGEGGAFHLRRQRRNAGVARGTLGAGQCGMGGRRLQSAHGDPRNDQFMDGSRGWRQGCGIELGKHAFSLVETADQQQAAYFEIARMGGVHPVAVGFQGFPRGVERLHRPAQVAGGEGDFGLGDDAACAGQRLLRTEGARRALQQELRPGEVAELRHGDAAQGERRRIVAQGDAVQRAEGIPRGQCARCGSDQRGHPNPATIVTPIVGRPCLV